MKLFFTLAAVIGTGVGVLALLYPAALLGAKGVALEPGTLVWVREVGVLIIASGVTSALIRRHPDSQTLRAFCIGSMVMQLGLLPIEIVAYADGTVTRLSGIVPNTIVHILLAAGFAWFAFRPQVRR